MYKDCCRLLSKSLGRFSGRKSIEEKFESTRERMQADPNLRAGEIARWIGELQDLLAASPAAETELQSIHRQLIRLTSGQRTQQFGIAGRDQFNIAGDATFTLNRD